MSSSREKSADEAAAAWLARLQTRVISTAELEEFFEWRRTPENDAAYDRAEAMWRDSATGSASPGILRALHGRVQGSRRFGELSRHPKLLLVAVAAGVLALVAVIPFGQGNSPHSYQTAVGERSTVRLSDGSDVQLDTDSALAAQFSNDRRAITLERGQAYFKVAHAAERPFVVDAGDGVTVTATGTQFDVRRTPDHVVVALIEGSVVVRQGNVVLATMKPGSLIEVANGQGLVSTEKSIAETIGWRGGHLTFRATPLAAAVAEVNRYTDAKLTIRKSGAATEPISGEFSTEDPDGFARAVNALLGDETIGN